MSAALGDCSWRTGLSFSRCQFLWFGSVDVVAKSRACLVKGQLPCDRHEGPHSRLLLDERVDVAAEYPGVRSRAEGCPPRRVFVAGFEVHLHRSLQRDGNYSSRRSTGTRITRSQQKLVLCTER